MTASIFLGIRSSKGLVVPAVMIWAFVGIGIALKYPDAAIMNQFDDVVISGVRNASLTISVIIAMVLGTRLAFVVFQECFTLRITEL